MQRRQLVGNVALVCVASALSSCAETKATITTVAAELDISSSDIGLFIQDFKGFALIVQAADPALTLEVAALVMIMEPILTAVQNDIATPTQIATAVLTGAKLMVLGANAIKIVPGKTA